MKRGEGGCLVGAVPIVRAHARIRPALSLSIRPVGDGRGVALDRGTARHLGRCRLPDGTRALSPRPSAVAPAPEAPLPFRGLPAPPPPPLSRALINTARAVGQRSNAGDPLRVCRGGRLCIALRRRVRTGHAVLVLAGNVGGHAHSRAGHCLRPATRSRSTRSRTVDQPKPGMVSRRSGGEGGGGGHVQTLRLPMSVAVRECPKMEAPPPPLLPWGHRTALRPPGTSPAPRPMTPGPPLPSLPPRLTAHPMAQAGPGPRDLLEEGEGASFQ